MLEFADLSLPAIHIPALWLYSQCSLLFEAGNKYLRPWYPTPLKVPLPYGHGSARFDNKCDSTLPSRDRKGAVS